MKKSIFKTFIIGLLSVWALSACKKTDTSIDTSAPLIDLTFAEAFPKQCAVFVKGDTAWVHAKLEDAGGLGSFSIDIHHNFDQHAHSTEVNTCVQGDKKTAIQPFSLIRTYTIEGQPKAYTIKVPIFIPHDVDAGDYHFMIRATDAQGWQSMRGISIHLVAL